MVENINLEDEEILKYMHEALDQCSLSLKLGEVPVGCIFLHLPSKQIVARGHNLTNKTKNATTHAEINCINEIYDILSDKEKKKDFAVTYELDLNTLSEIFSECVLFVSCEPCIMCAHALSLVSK